jgi:transposase
MCLDIDKLSNNPTELKGAIHSLTTTFFEEKRQYKIKIDILEEKIRLLQNKLFGRKSEKDSLPSTHEQLNIFNEVEEISSTSKPEEEQVEIPAYTRKKGGRKPISDDLPFIEKLHDLSPEEKICGCGKQLVRIGQEESKQLDIIPQKIQVIKHIRPKYACKSCEGVEDERCAVKIAPAPVNIIQKSIATAGLIAYIIISKFVDGLPLYRQEKIFERIGVYIPRATMAGWLIRVATQLEPMLFHLKSELLSGPLINIDETRLQVLREPGRANTTLSYMWAFRGGTPEKPVIIFQYHPTRSGKMLIKYLEGYKGHIQTDGYCGYDVLVTKEGIILLACWAHARRKFDEVIKAAKKDKNNKTGKAGEAIALIKKLYAVEKICKLQNLTDEQIYEERQKHSKPVLEEIKKWMDKTFPTTPPKGLLGKAISYTLNNWTRLIRYVDNGYLTIDNNMIENAIRPFVIGRKNFLFSGAPTGAHASALLYTLIETAKANGFEPYSYLRFIFEKAPLLKSNEEYKTLLPQYIDRQEYQNFLNQLVR